MTVYGLRMRLARLVAPTAIMRDPYPDEDGVFVLYRKRDGYSLEWAIRAERFRLKSTSRLAQMDYARTDPLPMYRPHGTFVRFVGTLGSR